MPGQVIVKEPIWDRSGLSGIVNHHEVIVMLNAVKVDGTSRHEHACVSATQAFSGLTLLHLLLSMMHTANHSSRHAVLLFTYDLHQQTTKQTA